MGNKILGNIDLEWFYLYLSKYTQKKFCIYENKFILKNKTFYKYLFAPKDGLKINLVQFIYKTSSDAAAALIDSIMTINERSKIRKYFGLDFKYSNFLMILFKLILEEQTRISNDEGSLLDLPSFKDYELSDDFRYKEYLENLIDKPLWTEKELLKVYDNVIDPLTKPNISKKKVKWDKKITKLVKDYRHYDQFGAQAFRCFVDIVYSYLSTIEINNNASEVQDSQATLQKNQAVSSSPDDMLTVAEAADYIKRPRSKIYQMTHKKKISFTKPSGGKVYIKRSDLDNYLKSGKVESKAKVNSDIIADMIFPPKNK